MHHLASLLLIAGIYLAVLASPGPNFFILSQMALDGRARAARYVVLGLTTGSVAWVLLSIAGVATLLAQHPQLGTALRVLGAAYLVWYGMASSCCALPGKYRRAVQARPQRWHRSLPGRRTAPAC